MVARLILSGTPMQLQFFRALDAQKLLAVGWPCHPAPANSPDIDQKTSGVPPPVRTTLAAMGGRSVGSVDTASPCGCRQPIRTPAARLAGVASMRIIRINELANNDPNKDGHARHMHP